jgi:hypothetical protein
MSESNWKPELLELIVAARDGMPAEADRIRLQTLVIESREACHFYLRQMHLAASLQWTFGMAGKLPEPTVPAAPATPRPGTFRRLTSAIHLSKTWVTLAAAVVFAAYVAVISWGMLGDKARGLRLEAQGAGNPRASDRAPRPSRLAPSGSAVATITGTSDAEWSAPAHKSAIRNQKSEITRGESLELASGLVELKLKQGAKLVIEGPAEWMIDGENNATLRRGKLVASVPKQAIGFELKTPTAVIVDLGTEFGVEVRDSGATDLHVLQGIVESTRVHDGEPDPSGLAPIRLRAGQAIQFNTRNEPAVKIAVNEKQFAKLRNSTTESDDSYARAILADRPLAYWRLSDGFREQARDESGNHHDGVYSGALLPNQPGILEASSNASIRFQGTAAEGSFAVHRLALGPSFTIELWAKSVKPVWNAHGWLGSARGPNGFIMHPYAGARFWQGYVFGDRTTTAREIGKHEPDRIDDRFHHYAITYDADADVGGMYFDGELVVKKSPLLAPHKRNSKAEIKLLFGHDPGATGAKLGDGWIDEVALYDRALPSNAIRAHYRAGVQQEDATKNPQPAKFTSQK